MVYSTRTTLRRRFKHEEGRRRSTRRLAGIAIAGVVLSTAACASQPSAAQPSTSGTTKLSVQVFSGSILNLPLYVAEKYGFYKKHGISVSYLPISNGPLSIQAVSSGKLDIGYGSFGTVIAAKSKGFDIKAIVADTNHNYWTLVASKKIPLPHLSEGYPAVMQDLVGKKIGVTARGAQSEFDVRTMFQEAGLPADSVTYVPVGSADTAFAALKNGTVDAVQAFDPTQTLALAAGIGVAVVDERKGEGPASLEKENGAYQLFFADSKNIAAHDAAFRGFVAAQAEAVAWLKDPANSVAAHDLAVQKVALGGLPKDVADKALSGLLDTYGAIWGSSIDSAAIVAANEYLLKIKIIKSAVDPSQLIYEGAPKPTSP